MIPPVKRTSQVTSTISILLNSVSYSPRHLLRIGHGQNFGKTLITIRLSFKLRRKQHLLETPISKNFQEKKKALFSTKFYMLNFLMFVVF